MSFLPLIVIMLLMYMFLIRPQQKRVKEQQALVRSLAAGDEVLLNSGTVSYTHLTLPTILLV